MKTMRKKVAKILLLIVGGLLAAVGLVIGGLNVAKYTIYRDYYVIKTDLCRNPGLGDGFVCQGIAAVEARGGDPCFRIYERSVAVPPLHHHLG